jgi:uncharacterized protein (TIGR02300 family)
LAVALKVRRLGLKVVPGGSCFNFSLTGGPLHGNGTPLNYPLKLQEIPAVAAPDIGTKRICPSCAAKFYDLSKKPIVCPKCAHSFTPEAIVKMRRPRSTASILRDTDEGAVRVKEARDDADETEEAEGAEGSEEEEEAEEEIKEVALDDEAIADPDLVEDEEAEDTDDKPEVVGDEVDLEEIEDDEDGDDEEDDTLIENVDDEDDVGGIIDKGDLDKE